MITKENLKVVLEDLTVSEVEAAINGKEDYLLIELHQSNGVFCTTIECREYDEETEADAGMTGDLFLDKDDFLRISGEVGINWEL